MEWYYINLVIFKLMVGWMVAGFNTHTRNCLPSLGKENLVPYHIIQENYGMISHERGSQTMYTMCFVYLTLHTSNMWAANGSTIALGTADKNSRNAVRTRAVCSSGTVLSCTCMCGAQKVVIVGSLSRGYCDGAYTTYGSLESRKHSIETTPARSS